MTKDIFIHTFTEDKTACTIQVNPEQLAVLADDMSISRNRTIIETIRTFVHMLVFDCMIRPGGNKLKQLSIIIMTPSGIEVTVVIKRRRLLTRILKLCKQKFTYEIHSNVDELLKLKALIHDA